MDDAVTAKVDHLIALQEGLYDLKALFLQDRETPEFKAAFAEKNPLVSVCVATYNRAELLVERCIRSILRQSYRNFQLIVVGDHCTDETEYVISKLGDSRISFLNLPVRGPYPRPGRDRWCVAGTNPMNHALSLVEGSFVAHLDDDDESSPERLERMVQQALETRAELLWHRFLYQGDEGIWRTVGGNELALGTVSTGSIFYHHYFARIPWDIYAFRLQEPGDWNRIRKLKFLGPRMQFVDECLMIHYREQSQEFIQQEGETFLEM